MTSAFMNAVVCGWGRVAGQDNKSPASHSPPVGMKEVADLKKTHFYGYHVATEDVWDVKQAVHPLLLQGNTNRP
jgi:hypothetical protein